MGFSVEALRISEREKRYLKNQNEFWNKSLNTIFPSSLKFSLNQKSLEVLRTSPIEPGD